MQSTSAVPARFETLPPSLPSSFADVERMAAWLASPAVRDRDGMLRSWCNPRRPGYRYAEATGYAVRGWLDLHRRSGERRWLAEARRSAEALFEAMDPATGAFGRGEHLYAFDTAVCASALLDATTIEGGASAARLALVRRALDFVAGCLARGVGSIRREDGRPPSGPERWSHAFGPHLIKSVAVLAKARARGVSWDCEVDLGRVARELCERSFDGSGFRIPGPDAAVYLHSHCYAVEGMLELERAGYAPSHATRGTVVAGTAWLAARQGPDGAVPRWWGRPGDSADRAADATAQAVRLWCVVDPDRFRDNVERGLEFIGQLGDSSGGVRYTPEHDDLNSWTTVFAMQAHLLNRFGPGTDSIA